MNPFEAGKVKVIPAVLVYARCESRILMIHKNQRKGDFHFDKWNGIGGKAEQGESPVETAQREFREEAGLDLPLEDFKPLGVLQFPNFKPAKSEDWWVSVFSVAISDPRSVAKACAEGTLHWVESDEVLKLNLWEGDRHFLDYVLREEPFLGTFWYKDQLLSRHWIQGLSQNC